jgi:hypothetical protein
VNPDQTLSYIVANVAPGSRIPIELIRDGKRQTVTVTVGTRPAEEQLAQQFDLEDNDSGPQDGETMGGRVARRRRDAADAADRALRSAPMPVPRASSWCRSTPAAMPPARASPAAT